MNEAADAATSKRPRATSGRRGGTGLGSAQRSTVDAWVRGAVAQVVLDRLDGSSELRQEVSAALEELGCKPVRSAPSLRMLDDGEEWPEGELDNREGTPYDQEEH